MAKFYLYMKQKGEGCDHTIGCGHLLIALEASTLEEAIAEADEDGDLASEGDSELDEAMIFAAPVHAFDLDAMREARHEVEEAESLKEIEDRERAELERLQAKFKK